MKLIGITKVGYMEHSFSRPRRGEVCTVLQSTQRKIQLWVDINNCGEDAWKRHTKVLLLTVLSFENVLTHYMNLLNVILVCIIPVCTTVQMLFLYQAIFLISLYVLQ